MEFPDMAQSWSSPKDACRAFLRLDLMAAFEFWANESSSTSEQTSMDDAKASHSDQGGTRHDDTRARTCSG
eukprot:7511760-Pyramimonas_sp.AAC.1